MGEAMEKLIAEIDESKIKYEFSTQCIKAQTLLTDKLKKQIQHQRETCGFISSANIKLQSEIAEAEQKLNSMLIAQKTINMANVELQKELLLTKEKKTDISKRIETGEKKYDVMWFESKNRYEAMAHVQKLINANEKLDNFKKEILKLDETSLKLVEEIDTKTKNCADIQKKRAIELAEFIVRDMPNYHKIIGEKTKQIAELSEKIRVFEMKVTHSVATEEKVQAHSKTADDSKWSMLKTDDIVVMPTLELPTRDLDALNMQLDKVNIKNTNTDDSNNETKETFTKTRFEINMFQSNNKDDLISSYFPKQTNYDVNKTENYSKKKLINILKDVKVNKDAALKMMSKANRSCLAPVEAIGAECINAEMIPNSPRSSLDNKCKEPIQSEEIEEIDLTAKSAEDILNPPSPFLDMTAITITDDNLQEVDDEELSTSVKEALEPQDLLQQNDVASTTKRVSFNLSPNTKSNEADKAVEENAPMELNVSAASDDGYANIKDMVMKKHNLDLSPQFVYAKNTKLQKNTETNIVTSKFFHQNENDNTDVTENEPANNKEPAKKAVEVESYKENQTQEIGQGIQNMELNADYDEDAVASPKRRKLTDEPPSVKPVSGLVFNHGPNAIMESFDLSFSTTGYEDRDNDYPHCIDSSVLLSPKANIPTPSGDNTEVSQEVPNFLSGLRKTGLSFFGRLPTSESKPDSNTAINAGTSGGFSFNFGSKDEKKARGGLFSMFQ